MEISNNNHIVKLTDRSNIIINSINKIIDFDSREISIESSMGIIIIKGSDLEVIKLDTIDGNISVKGNIDGINYLDSAGKNKDSMITKLFKWVICYI